MRTLVVIGAIVAAAACGLGSAFACEDDAQCDDRGQLGVCQAGGACSFPDGSCPSGQRYGEHVGGAIAGECVPLDDDTTGSAGETTATNASGVDDVADDDDAPPLDTTSDVEDSAATTGPVGVDDTGSSDDGIAEGSTGTTEIDPDLVLWLTFDDPQAPLADSSNYARAVACDDATAACPEVIADGAMDLAALLDGTNDLLQVPHDPALETDQGLTVAVRVRNDAASVLNIHTVIARPYGVVTDNSWELFFRDEDGDGVNNVVFEIADPGGQLQLVAPLPAAKGEWVRIVAVWAGDSTAIYYDGVLQVEGIATGMLFDDGPIIVGGDFDNVLPANWFTGALDDIRVYRRVLSEAEIAALL